MENVVIKTVAAIRVCSPFPKTLRTGLNYARAPWWEEDGWLYILNCALADAQIFCRNAQKEEFFWGQAEGALCRYDAKNGKLLEQMPWTVIPADYRTHGWQVSDPLALDQALKEERTFLSRASHRRAAYCPPMES